MRAAAIDRFDAPEVLTIHKLPVPHPASGEVRIAPVLHLKKNESIIIHGASDGVGTLAVQFARLRGAHVFATASGKDGIALVRRLGAEAAVDGRHDDIVAAARRFAPNGFDAVLARMEGGHVLGKIVLRIH
jgi:NADPH:quinone reductase-like Zn-dependent oxidoreductase